MILPLQAQQRGPIIDMHLHAGPDDSLRQRVVALMDELHIVKAFLSSSLENVYRVSHTRSARGPRRLNPKALGSSGPRLESHLRQAFEISVLGPESCIERASSRQNDTVSER